MRREKPWKSPGYAPRIRLFRAYKKDIGSGESGGTYIIINTILPLIYIWATALYSINTYVLFVR